LEERAGWVNLPIFIKYSEMKGECSICHFSDLVEERCFFVTALEEDGFSLLNSNLREEDALNSKGTEEEDVDSNKQMI
jgi:hypothetical protein